MANSSQSGWQRVAIKLMVLTLRVLVGGVFTYAGFVKAIDIWGLGYKIDDYLEAFGWTFAMPFGGILSVALPIFEFLAGIMLIIGSFRRFTVIALLTCMAFMLPLSAYIMATDPVPDCGCFGDAWIISNTATFWKNLALTAGLITLLIYNKRLRSLYGPAVQWLTALFPALFIIIVIFMGHYVQPLKDYRPYSIGTMLTSASSDDDTDYVFIYEKDGAKKEFTVDNLPDTTWTFVDRKDISTKSQTHEASPITAYDSDESTVDNLISPSGITLVLLIPDLKEINALTNFNINDLNDIAANNGWSMICLTGSDEAELEEWRELSMADYPVYRMDDSQLKQIARGNPAVVIVENGKVAFKSTFGFFYSNLEGIDKNKHIDYHVWTDTAGDAADILLLLKGVLLVLLVVLLLVNRTPLVVKFLHSRSKKRPTVVEVVDDNADEAGS